MRADVSGGSETGLVEELGEGHTRLLGSIEVLEDPGESFGRGDSECVLQVEVRMATLGDRESRNEVEAVAVLVEEEQDSSHGHEGLNPQLEGLGMLSWEQCLCHLGDGPEVFRVFLGVKVHNASFKVGGLLPSALCEL